MGWKEISCAGKNRLASGLAIRILATNQRFNRGRHTVRTAAISLKTIAAEQNALAGLLLVLVLLLITSTGAVTG